MNKREWILTTVSGVYASGAQIRDDVNIPLFFSKMYDSIIDVTKEQGGNLHPDSLAVDRFSNAMKVKLSVSRGKGRGGWENKEDCTNEYLSSLLREHVEKGDPVDVANFCMMLHQRGERIS